MSETPLKDARDASVKCVGFTNHENDKQDNRIPTQAEVDQEAMELKTPEELLQESREKMVSSPLRFKMALTRSGTKRKEVEDMVANPQTGHDDLDQDIKDGWTSAGDIRRLDALALYVQWALCWNDEEADALFELADTL